MCRSEFVSPRCSSEFVSLKRFISLSHPNVIVGLSSRIFILCVCLVAGAFRSACGDVKSLSR